MNHVHSMEIRWPVCTAWKSGGICKQSGDWMGYGHTAWRFDELCIHKLEMSWLHHIRKLQMTQLECVCAVTIVYR